MFKKILSFFILVSISLGATESESNSLATRQATVRPMIILSIGKANQDMHIERTPTGYQTWYIQANKQPVKYKCHDPDHARRIYEAGQNNETTIEVPVTPR